MNIHRAGATKLRDEGYSYSFISQKTGVSKSTLSNWFRDRPFVPNAETLERTKAGQLKYGMVKKQSRKREIERLLASGYYEVGKLSKRDLWMVGMGLWLGEGSKTVEQIRLANSDPEVIKLWLRWLREVCNLNDENITVRMHLYKDSNHEVCASYWQTVTQLSACSFRKTQVDRRTSKMANKKGKLPYGTLHVSVVAARHPERGVRLYRRMKGWLSAIID